MGNAEYRKTQAERCLRYADWVSNDQQKEFWRRCAEDWQRPPTKLASRSDVIGSSQKTPN